MAITQFNEVIGLKGQHSLQSGKGVRTYSREFQVLVNDPTTTENDVLAHPSCPRRLDSHPRDALAVCTSVNAEQDAEQAVFYTVKAEYTTEKNGQNPQEEQEYELNPLLKPYEIRTGFRRGSEIFWKDLDGIAVVNSAKEPYDPPVEIERGIFVIEIVRNEAINPEWRSQVYMDAINYDWWRYYRPGTARITDLSGQSVFERNLRYYSVRYQIEINHKGWDVEVLDRGLNQRISGVLSPIYVDSAVTTSPVLLDGTGLPAPRPLPADWEPKFNKHKGYQKLAFAPLSLVF